MIVTWWKGVFVADSLDEKGALTKAGFRLHDAAACNLDRSKKCKACIGGIGKRYWSDKIEAATRLREFCNERALRTMKEHLSRLERSAAVDADIVIPSPPGLSYLGYQKAGVAYALQRKDTLIGDDMGLGKTIQALGFINYTHPKNVLIICPKSLVFNWRDEAMKWLVDDFQIWPIYSKKDIVPKRDGLFVIANYEKLVGTPPVCKVCGGKKPDKIEWKPVPPCPACKGTGREEFDPLVRSLQRDWDVLALDEAQAIKNENSARSQAILGDKGLMRRARRCLFLTGTPIENYPKEIWPIAAAIAPAKFGNWWEFMARYCGLHKEPRKIAKYNKEGEVVSEHTKEEWVSTGATNLAELQQRLRATFMVRRLKRDVLPELPPKRRQLVILEDSKVDWSSHPQFKKWKEAYEKAYEEKLARLEASKSHEEYLTAANELETFTGILFQEMSEFRKVTAMAKLPLCLKYTEHILDLGVKNLVIWCHHTAVIEQTVEHFKDIAVAVHGKTPDRGPKSRENLVKQFQAGEKKIFVGQMRAAGSGINLTACNTTLFYESDWVPGVLSQCEDRLCRIGQKKMVHAVHLILGGTLDANMVKKVVQKQEIIDRALDKMPEVKLKKIHL